MKAHIGVDADSGLVHTVTTTAANAHDITQAHALQHVNQPSHALRDKLEKLKASIRAKVEHPFRVIKCQFGHRKVCYRGLAKNTSLLLVMFALLNLWMVRKRFLSGSAVRAQA